MHVADFPLIPSRESSGTTTCIARFFKRLKSCTRSAPDPVCTGLRAANGAGPQGGREPCGVRLPVGKVSDHETHVCNVWPSLHERSFGSGALKEVWVTGLRRFAGPLKRVKTETCPFTPSGLSRAAVFWNSGTFTMFTSPCANCIQGACIDFRPTE